MAASGLYKAIPNEMFGWPICLSACLPICLSVYLPVCLSAYLSVCLSVCLSICLSTVYLRALFQCTHWAL